MARTGGVGSAWPRIARTTLANGLVVAVAENPSHASVVIRLVVQGGQAAEPRELAGLAHLTNRAVVLRCQRLATAELDDLLDEHGIVLLRGSDRHACEIVVRCPSESLGVALELVAELAQRPLFGPHEVQAMAQQMLRGIAQQALDATAGAVTAFRQLAYPTDHPYSRQPLGLANTVGRIQVSDVDDFYRRHFRPERSVLVVAGDVRLADLEGCVGRLFGDWSPSGAGAPPLVSRVPRPAGVRQSYPLERDGLAHVVVGGPAAARIDPSFRALHFGTLIVGQLGLQGRLGARLRERDGVAYECYAALEDAPSNGLWTARASVRAGDVDRVVDVILAEMRRIRDEPVSAAELAACRTLCRGGFDLQMETNAGLASLLQTMATYGFAADYIEAFSQELEQITPADIQAACQTWLAVDDPLIVTTTPIAS